ncbi:unnamed protein product [Arctia plantaginis]|uniref:Uncharacterized protein n=1 Tax=Arctia plantaginis TaxID=874455 RepID=A0A8S0ZNU8_ARCPL|nr:unnamed protein product [Arctia plantaginis]
MAPAFGKLRRDLPAQYTLPGPKHAAHAIRYGSWLCSYRPENMEWWGPSANTATSSPPCVSEVTGMSTCDLHCGVPAHYHNFKMIVGERKLLFATQ